MECFNHFFRKGEYKMDTKVVSRRYDLDWIRVLAILSIFVYHSCRAFNLDWWHIKDPAAIQAFTNFTRFMDLWMMPLVFVVSGAAVYLSMQQPSWRAAGKFLKDKMLRLLVPLIVADFTHIAIQVYIERLTHGDFNGSFWQFIPHYFEGWYGFGGNFGWIGLHLWYIVVLLFFSIIFLPLFLLLKTNRGNRGMEAVGNFFALPGMVYVLVLLLVTAWKGMGPVATLLDDSFNWGLGIYATFFLFGFFFLASGKLQDSIKKLRWISLVLAIGMSVWYMASNNHDDLAAWAIVLTALGMGMTYLNFKNPFLTYANEAVLPFYILHQTVIVMVDYFIIQLPISVWVKVPMVIIISFSIIMTIYEFAIRRVNFLRICFGMKPVRKESRQPAVQN
jgi:glucans biosynthesis protein C